MCKRRYFFFFTVFLYLNKFHDLFILKLFQEFRLFAEYSLKPYQSPHMPLRYISFVPEALVLHPLHISARVGDQQIIVVLHISGNLFPLHIRIGPALLMDRSVQIDPQCRKLLVGFHRRTDPGLLGPGFGLSVLPGRIFHKLL